MTAEQAGLTGAGAWSGRRSGRLDRDPDSYAQMDTLEGSKGPETLSHRWASMSPGAAGSPGAAVVPERRASRVSVRQLIDIGGDLSPREAAILHDLDRFRFLRSTQIEALHFYTHASPAAASRICRRTLQRLAELRVIEHLERRVGGIHAGSASFVWRVGSIGDRLLRSEAARAGAARARRKEPSPRHLDHTLAIADCYVALTRAARIGSLEVISVATEPTSWRRYLGAGGNQEILKPDLYTVTAVQTPDGAFEDHAFCEIDRGSESVPTVLAKCGQYERYRRTGQEQADSGVFPLVIWVVPDARRAAVLSARIERARNLDSSLFRVVTSDDFVGAVSAGAS